MKTYSFFIEESITPIYQRIAQKISNELRLRGHRVILERPPEGGDSQRYRNRLSNLSPDYVLLTNSYSQLYKAFGEEQKPLYEALKTRLIFLHHDNLFTQARTISDVEDGIESYLRCNDIGYHFCLEYHNFIDLRELGIRNCFSVMHSSEFIGLAKDETSPTTHEYDVSFVGHVVSVSSSPEEVVSDLIFSHRLLADYYNRLRDFTHKIEPSADAFSQMFEGSEDLSAEQRIAWKYFYHTCVHSLTQRFRGDVTSRLGSIQMDIFGGHPRNDLHLQAGESAINLTKESIRYHPPGYSFREVQSIYASSKISLNITALQFDQAVTNRVLDIGACGGFPLTDYKQDLKKITSVSDEISYKTLEELRFKIDYYLHPDHAKERDEIAKSFQKDITSKFSYGHLVDTILETISDSPPMLQEPKKIDIGCGVNKAADFVGVDRFPHPLVDVVADLNQRFPFSANSVEIVRAHDALEHLKDPIHTMNEIWRICKHNSLVDIRVPSTDGRGAFQDPTHISFWNRNSFHYYCIEYPAYLCLCRSYGFLGSFRLERLTEAASSDGVIHVNAVLRALKPSTELIEKYSLRSINVILRVGGNTGNEIEPQASTWKSQLRQLLTSACQSASGSHYCFIFDHIGLEANEFMLEAGSAMLEAMLSVPTPPSGDYPGVSILPSADEQDHALIVSVACEQTALEDYLSRSQEKTRQNV
ncbi:MAG: glycosyltransferase [Prochlorococcaceae cyanobacterium]